jgi:hypothetical protein
MLPLSETRYAVIEVEIHTVSWATKKCHIFLLACPLSPSSPITIQWNTTLSTPQPIPRSPDQESSEENGSPFSTTTVWMKLKTPAAHSPSSLQLPDKWQKGKDNDAADALSRHLCSWPNPGEDMVEHDVDVHGSLSTVRCIRLTELRAQHEDNLRLQ